MPKKITREEIEEIVNSFDYSLLDIYTKKYDKATIIKVIIADDIGYKYDVQLGNLRRGNGLSFVDKRSPIIAIENISLWLTINNPYFELCDNNIYIGGNKDLKFLHNIPECQEKFDMCWDNIYQGYGCPVCRGFQVGERNSLAYLRPDIANEWHSQNKISPSDITVSSGKRVYWVCSNPECRYGENLEWYAQICNRTNGKGCPACSNPPRVVTDRNRLSIRFPEVASEWNFTKNGKLTPYDVSYGSSKDVWWLCPNGHEYHSAIKGRTTRNRGCKICSSSKGEDRILSWVEKNISNLQDTGIIRCKPQKIFSDCKDKGVLPFDFCFEYQDSTWSVTEFQGEQHFKLNGWHGQQAKKNGTTPEEEFENQKRRDKIKQKYCEDNNLPLLIIPYWEFDNIEQILTETFLK